MAIGSMRGAAGMAYDINRDMYYSERERYEKELFYRRQEEEYRRMQNHMHPPGQDSPSKYVGQPPDRLGQAMLMSKAPNPDPKDPLSFLSKADHKLLLTGATS